MAFGVLLLTLTPFLITYFNIEIVALEELASRYQPQLPNIILGAGVLFSIALFGLMLVQARGRARSEAMAESLRRSEANVAMEKERLAVTLDAIREGVISCDHDGIIVSMNHSAENLTGWLRTDAIGLPLEKVYSTVHEKTHEPRPNPLENGLRVGGLAGRVSKTLLVAKDHSERPIADHVSRVLDGEGKLVGAVLVFRDITEDQRTEEELLKESKLESVGKLAGGIAHDYNNILTGMIGHVALVRRMARSPQEVIKGMENLERAVMRAKDLTQQLLTFSDGGAPVKRATYLEGLIREATKFALHGTNVQSEFRFTEGLWPAEVDEGQFRQTIHNIVTNAVQAMPEGGKVTIHAVNTEVSPGRISAMRGGKCVQLSIVDTGHGFNTKHLAKIFDPYFSTRKDGSGLGLATAYSIIRKHGGHIVAANQPEGGAAISICIPACQKPMEVHQPDEKVMSISAGEFEVNSADGPTSKRRVLVMDDEADILTVVSAMLEVQGFEVETAGDGKEAIGKYQIAKSKGNPFDIVIMDLTIPNGMGGKEAVQKLLAVDPGVKVIVSSGYSYDPVMSDYRKYGFSGVMPKPYRMEDLGKILIQVIAASPASTEKKVPAPAEEDVLSFGRIQNKLRASATSREI
jgi:PAS domain S-box-containing protein